MTSDSASEFARKHRLRVVARLGEGKDGVVFSTDRGTAVKLLYDLDGYSRELRAYRVLAEEEIDEILGYQVPRLRLHDDELRAIEMTIVSPPFLLDFAAAYTEDEVERFAFSAEVMEERQAHWSEIFGARWPEAVAIREAFFRQTGLVLLDLSLNNIRFD